MRLLSRVGRQLVRPLVCWLAVPSLFACGTDSLKPPVVAEPSDVYWSLTLDHRAITMGRAPYDTITIGATPRNVAGEALAGLPAPTYLSRDVAKVTVTPEGFVRVLGSSFDPVWVVATLVAGNVRHMDSLRVRGVDLESPPVLTTFSIHPVPPDSAKRGIGNGVGLGPGLPPLPAYATDANGLPITDLMVSFRSLDSSVAKVDETTGKLGPLSVGDVVFTASTTMFGVTKVDTLPYRIGWPVWVSVATDHPSVDTLFANVGVGAVVALSYTPAQVGDGVSIDFDDADLPHVREATAFVGFDAFGLPSFCLFFRFDCNGSGNIVITPPNLGALRIFTAPGMYDYHVSPYGVTGHINVIDER